MKPRFREAYPKGAFWTVSLLVTLAASACAPALTNVPSPATEAIALPTGTPASANSEASVSGSTATQPAEVEAVATSRGPELEATDPTIVSLASGQLQLVEFFRFT